MTKITHRLLICFVLCFHLGAVPANSVIFDKYAWANRLVILITKKNDTNLEKKVKTFFERHVCEIDERNLKLLHFHTDNLVLAQLPKVMRAKTGLWLLGYDGSIKDFSEDGQLLDRLFQTIDGMPIRQEEMASGLACG